MDWPNVSIAATDIFISQAKCHVTQIQYLIIFFSNYCTVLVVFFTVLQCLVHGLVDRWHSQSASLSVRYKSDMPPVIPSLNNSFSAPLHFTIIQTKNMDSNLFGEDLRVLSIDQLTESFRVTLNTCFCMFVVNSN